MSEISNNELLILIIIFLLFIFIIQYIQFGRKILKYKINNYLSRIPRSKKMTIKTNKQKRNK